MTYETLKQLFVEFVKFTSTNKEFLRLSGIESPGAWNDVVETSAATQFDTVLEGVQRLSAKEVTTVLTFAKGSLASVEDDTSELAELARKAIKVQLAMLEFVQQNNCVNA